ncbi:conjugal transfer protein TrbE [Sphingobium sp. 22B]|uniref:conjugal transfer protein TrbE n=1 Tax=unclassified Sphingobium TaxID=2611147 RepID=UPI000782CB1F|nr:MULTISPECIES: conjugal transfer protein TrbE [unclassified Sphingobium]KXU32391.1 conjugal transfer protein TrbE [Sphingobium sp. AM]KYC32284.1 conjugal transfer protein TrbE [Sphingobium sp. 22B]OAP31914.1 conjugal transfer protein TrbE [Sphingobium sp. 20006FA]
MMFLREHARRASRLSDFLPWAALIAPGIILNKDGSFLRIARFRGPDLDSATQAELIATSSRLNSALKRLGTGWAIYVEAQRKESPGYPASKGFIDPVSALIDEERRDQFDGGDVTQPNFTSAYYLTLQWLPPADDTSKASALFYEGGAAGVATAADHLDNFERDSGRVLDMIEGVMPEAIWLSDAETLTYLHSTISTHDQRIAVPETPMHLDALLSDEVLVGGLAPQLGSKHLRTLSVTGFPAVTVPGMLDELNRLGFAYRWTTRAICLDKVAAQRMLGRIRRLWFSKRKSLAAIIKEVLTNEASVLVDTDAANKSAEADAALQDLGADIAGYAYVTTTITVLGDSPRDADLRLQAIEKIVRGRDFACIVEGLNALEAWLGSLPGNPYANVRQPPVSTLNLAHIMPVSAVWAGPDRDGHFKAPPLFHARTQGSTPFRLSLHVGDVGHTLVVGPTGSGKSVLLAFMALQFRRYEGAQVFAFDHGGSIRAATLGVGGEWHDLGGALGGTAAPVSLQPLARIDELDERAWAADWLAAILAREEFAITPEVKDHLWTALGSLADAPVQQRTLTGLAVLIQASGLKRALAPYTLAGPYGRLLDGDVEHFGESDAQAFETEGLVGTTAAPAVLAYLFHRIGRRLDGPPTLILIDEGWLALDDPLFGRQLKEWLKTLRKKNASVVFATQSLADIEGSAIAPAIIESCPTRLFLANERALEPQITGVYRRFGLNDRQIEIIASATPKRDYYCQSALGNRLFDLGLGPVALAFAAASSRSDLNAISALVEQHGADGFAAAWLRHRGLRWAADLLTAPTLEPQEAFA